MRPLPVRDCLKHPSLLPIPVASETLLKTTTKNSRGSLAVHVPQFTYHWNSKHADYINKPHAMKRPSSTFQHFIDVKNHRSHCPDNPAGCSLCNKYLELRGWRERPQGFVMCPPWLQRESLWAHWNPSLAKTAIPALNYIVLRDQGSLLGSLLPHRKSSGWPVINLEGALYHKGQQFWKTNEEGQGGAKISV